jgi:predicted dehydrogenase
MRIGYRTGDMWAPQYDRTEALQVEALHFIKCIEGKEQPITDGEMGLRVVKILEAATLSMKERGRLVELHKKRFPA